MQFPTFSFSASSLLALTLFFPNLAIAVSPHSLVTETISQEKTIIANAPNRAKSIPIRSLNLSLTIVRGVTTVQDIQAARNELIMLCFDRFQGRNQSIQKEQCRAEVVRATSIDALRFLNGL